MDGEPLSSFPNQAGPEIPGRVYVLWFTHFGICSATGAARFNRVGHINRFAIPLEFLDVSQDDIECHACAGPVVYVLL